MYSDRQKKKLLLLFILYDIHDIIPNKYYAIKRESKI